MIDHQSELSNHFADLYFIPGVPELMSVNAAVKKVNKVDGNTPFAEVLKLAARPASYDNADVRAQSLQKLKQLLWPNQGKLQELIVGGERAHAIITKLVNLLVRFTADPDPEVVLLAGECLGHVGAVDPGRLQQAEDLSRNLVKY